MSTKTMKKRSTMKVTGRSYASVSDVVRDMSDAETADNFDKYQSERRLVNGLVVVRCAKDVSQAELAAKMGCGQSKVSKMESSADFDLSFGDIVKYASALKQSVHIAFSPVRTKGSDHIRFHLACIKHELDCLVEVAGNDKEIGEGVESFAIETMQRMLSVIEDSIDKLPHRSRASEPVTLEVEGDRGQRLPLDSPTRTRRRSTRRPVTA